jgi:hypothetical protein
LSVSDLAIDDSGGPSMTLQDGLYYGIPLAVFTWLPVERQRLSPNVTALSFDEMR